MKILTISKEPREVNWDQEQATLKKEASEVWKLYLDEKVREIYFTDDGNAVLILECQDVKEAKKLVNRLPLVKKKLITFEFRELRPYAGFSRIMDLSR